MQLGVIFSHSGVLVFGIIRYGNELKDPKEVHSGATAKAKITERELAMAQRLVSDMSGKFKPDLYRDTYQEKLQQAIEAKLKGRKSVKPKTAQAAPKKSVDIVELLKT